MRKPRNNWAAFKSLRRETSITPFSCLTASRVSVWAGTDRASAGGRLERTNEGKRAATATADRTLKDGLAEQGPFSGGNNEEEVRWRNRNRMLRTAGCARYGVPSDATGCQDSLSEDGPDRAVSD